MKKGTKIAFVITLIYWSSSSYALYKNIKSDFLTPTWLDNILLPGNILGFIGGYSGGNIPLFIGQIITFLILFFISKSILNRLIYKLKN